MDEPCPSADDIAAHLGIANNIAYTRLADEALPAYEGARLWKSEASKIDNWERRGGATVSFRNEDTE